MSLKRLVLMIFITSILSMPLMAQFHSDLIITSSDGIWTDERAYADLNTAITAIGAKTRTLVIADQITTGTSTIPSNVTLKFERDGNINTTTSLTINTKNIIAPDRTIFSGPGSITFADGSIIKSSWFSSFYVAAVRTVSSKITLVISKQETLSNSVALGNNINLKFESPESRLTIANGITLSNVGNIEAGDFQILTAAGTGAYTFKDGVNLNNAWFPSFRTAISFIGSSKATLLIHPATTIDYDQTVPLTLTLDFEYFNGNLSINTGVTLAVGDTYINVKRFGAKGDGITSDCDAITKAWKVLTYSMRGGTLDFPVGIYRCDTGLDFSSSVYDNSRSYKIKGVGRGSQLLTHNANISLDLGGRDRVIIEDFEIYDDGTTAKVGINKQRTFDVNGTGHYHIYRNLTIFGYFSIACVYSIGVEVNSYYDVRLSNYGTGAGFYSDTDNTKSLTSANAYPVNGSNTVNNFYGGMIGSVAGSAVSLRGGVDNLSFWGTYLYSATGNGVLINTPGIQGKVTLDNVRIETSGANAHGVYMESGVLEVWGLHLKRVQFGLTNATSKDVYWPVNAGGNGFIGGSIEDCWHGTTNSASGGISLKWIRQSVIKYGDYDHVVFSHPPLTVDGGIVGSYIEVPNLSLSATTVVAASKIVSKNKSGNQWIERFGPNASYHLDDDLASTLSIVPQQEAPAVPEEGMLANADGIYWDPASYQQGRPYIVMYNGTAWRPLIPITSIVNSVGQLSYTDANTNEKILHTLTIPAGTLGPDAYKQVLRIRASGGTQANANTKTIKLKITDGVNTVVMITNSVTTAPNGLAWLINSEISMASTYAVKYWSKYADLTFNGVATQSVLDSHTSVGQVIDFSQVVTISITGQSAVGTQYDISCLSLSWELVQSQ